jgi:hypothetical protein
MRRVALVQLEDAHHFCLPSQSMLLHEAGWEVHLAYPEWGRAKVEGMPGVSGYAWHRVGRGGLGAYRELRAWLRRTAIDRVLLNTAHGNVVRNFLWLCPGVRAAGLLHEAGNLRRSASQRMISWRMRHYLPLSELSVELARSLTRVPVTAFYPIFMPPAQPAPRDPAHLILVIPGQVEQQRRDYRGFFAHLGSGLDPRVRLLVLGSGSADELAAVRAAAERAGVAANLDMDGRYVPEAEFQSRCASCDAILPLIHGAANGKRYFETRVTGAHLIALIHRKPMLLDPALCQRDEVAACALPTGLDGMQARLNALVADRAPLHAAAARMAAYPLFSRDEQRRRLLAALD